jgi:short-subunit dehydrogenase
MSKHAVEAYTDALAAEMARFGVKVSALEPGNYQSDIGKSLLTRMEAKGKLEKTKFRQEITRFAESKSQDPASDDVAAAALRALSDPNPLPRYLIVPNPREAEVTIRKVLQVAAQLNQGYQASYSRDSLVAMLDQALARAGATSR